LTEYRDRPLETPLEVVGCQDLVVEQLATNVMVPERDGWHIHMRLFS
jgi:hypothetical protein